MSPGVTFILKNASYRVPDLRFASRKTLMVVLGVV